MKVKHFLRGLGMGIVFSALLLTIAGGTKKETLTDEEIMARASLLGMVRPEESQPPATETPAVAETPAATETPAVTETPAATEMPAATETPEPSVTDEPAKIEEPKESEKPKETEKPEEPEYVTVTIKGGMWSRDVAKAMAAAGLVSSAEKFDEYLCDHGYASSISTGTFQIRIGADFNEIAEEITK